MAYSIRPYHSKDFVAIKELFLNLVREEAKTNLLRLAEPEQGYGDWYTKRAVSFVEKGTGCIGVAESEGKIVGCVNGYIRELTDDDLLGKKKLTIGHIPDLIVRSEYRHQGIGTKLLTFIEDFFIGKHCDCIELTVNAHNPSAHAMYKRFGYEDSLVEMNKFLNQHQ